MYLVRLSGFKADNPQSPSPESLNGFQSGRRSTKSLIQWQHCMLPGTAIEATSYSYWGGGAPVTADMEKCWIKIKYEA